MKSLKTKRVYEPAEKADGYRVLVDRLWPRGISKEEANWEIWLKEVAPSSELRKWFNHEPKKWKAFKEKYHKEINDSPAFDELLKILKKHPVTTLVYGAKDETHNQAVALAEFLQMKK